MMLAILRTPPGRLCIGVLITGLAWLMPGFATHTEAQTDLSSLTVVRGDGHLWALPPNRAPQLIHRDLGAGAAVTDLAWSPVRPELLVVRRLVLEGEPYDSLVRVDLPSGVEETLLDHVGPQARIERPRWGPDGTWAYARVECCLSRQMVSFHFPSAEGSSTQIAANRFLPDDAREVSLVEAGPVDANGDLLMAVHCCMGSEPEPNPQGFYLVPLSLLGPFRLTDTPPATPVGLTLDGESIIALRERMSGPGSIPVVVSRSDDTERMLPFPEELQLSDRGEVLPDGEIALASEPSGIGSVIPRYVDVWRVSLDGSEPRNVTKDLVSGFTAWAWVSDDVLAPMLQPEDDEFGS